MDGDPRIDELMRPVLAAIKRHVKDSDAKTEIYNRAYEAIMISMDVNKPAEFVGLVTDDVNKPSKSNVSVSGNVLTDIKTSHPVKSDGSGITFCPNCEAETDCHFDAELWSCSVCGEDFASYTKPAYNAAEKRNAELEAAARWIPVSEFYPKESGTYMGWCAKEEIFIGFTFSKEWTLSIDKRITHCHKLPQPPKPEEK